MNPYALAVAALLTEFVATLNACATEAARHGLSPTCDPSKRCTDPVRTPLGVDIAAARQVLQVRSAYQAAQASELANSVCRRPANAALDADDARAFGAPGVFGDLPLVVVRWPGAKAGHRFAAAGRRTTPFPENENDAPGPTTGVGDGPLRVDRARWHLRSGAGGLLSS